MATGAVTLHFDTLPSSTCSMEVRFANIVAVESSEGEIVVISHKPHMQLICHLFTIVLRVSALLESAPPVLTAGRSFRHRA